MTRPDEPLPDDVDAPKPDTDDVDGDETVPPFEVDTEKLRVKPEADE